MSVRSKELVLVVDDDDDVRALLQDALEATGFVVLSARDGDEAIARLHAYTGHVLAIVDLAMPGTDGHALIERLRARQVGGLVRIIVLTGSDTDGVDGADRLLRKPCTMATLFRVVNELSLATK